MNSWPPGSQNQNQLSASYNDRIKGQKWQNNNSENWEYYLRLSKQRYGDDYFWTIELKDKNGKIIIPKTGNITWDYLNRGMVMIIFVGY